MDGKEFTLIRRTLKKTQTEMARLLGISEKAVQSFEQGWRNIPAHSERQILFLMALKQRRNKKSGPCWAITRCPLEIRHGCPTWQFRAGGFCWFINGTTCRGKVRKNWADKMRICRDCQVYRGLLQNVDASEGEDRKVSL
jgi:hypothetical protein